MFSALLLFLKPSEKESLKKTNTLINTFAEVKVFELILRRIFMQLLSHSMQTFLQIKSIQKNTPLSFEAKQIERRFSEIKTYTRLSRLQVHEIENEFYCVQNFLLRN